MSWKNGSTQTITSNTTIPTDEWHQVAIIYTGGNANLYIDGILDKIVKEYQAKELYPKSGRGLI
mgnify:CR=1 FL=1